MNFEHSNSVARGSKKMLKRIFEFEVGTLYPIEAIRKVDTKYGDKVVVDLKGDILCYLPCRVLKELLTNEAAEFIEFQISLKHNGVSLGPLEDRHTPIEFVPTPC